MRWGLGLARAPCTVAILPGFNDAELVNWNHAQLLIHKEAIYQRSWYGRISSDVDWQHASIEFPGVFCLRRDTDKVLRQNSNQSVVSWDKIAGSDSEQFAAAAHSGIAFTTSCVYDGIGAGNHKEMVYEIGMHTAGDRSQAGVADAVR